MCFFIVKYVIKLPTVRVYWILLNVVSQFFSSNYIRGYRRHGERWTRLLNSTRFCRLGLGFWIQSLKETYNWCMIFLYLNLCLQYLVLMSMERICWLLSLNTQILHAFHAGMNIPFRLFWSFAFSDLFWSLDANVKKNMYVKLVTLHIVINTANCGDLESIWIIALQNIFLRHTDLVILL